MPTHVVLGRSIGISDEKLAHLGDDPLPGGVYTPAEAVAIRYAQRITRMEGIDDQSYAELADHYSAAELVELCFVVGMSNLINRFHATFHTDVDEQTTAAVSGSCPLPIPPADRRARGGT